MNDLPTYAQVSYANLYNGIDLTHKSAGPTVKYEYRVAPGADYRQIQLAYQGTRGLSLDKGGNLIIPTAWGNLTDEKPVTYQMVDGKKVAVVSGFLVQNKTVGFSVGKYSRNLPLFIDPGLSYSTRASIKGGCSLIP